MNLAEELKTTAIVGTGRKSLDLSAADGKLGETLSKLDCADQEQFLLAAAAVYSAWQTAGKTVLIDDENSPEIAEAETRKILAGSLKQIYEAQLISPGKTLFLEVLDLMKRHEKIIPPELLPPTFALADTHFQTRKSEFRRKILPVAGNRGRWLARQNVDWRWILIEEEAAEIFETGKAGERVFALEYLRKQDANKAGEILRTNWKSESAKERQDFIEVLRTGLNAADEAFLDEILQTDKSAEVRQTAYELLATLPDSKLIKNSTAQFWQLVDFVKGGIIKSAKIGITFPQDFENKEFVYYPFPKTKSDLGRKGWKLAQIISAVSLAEIEKGFSVNAKDFVAAVKNNPWTAEIYLGLSAAAARQKNFDWYEALATGFKQKEIAAAFEGKHQSRINFSSNQQKSAASLSLEKKESISKYLLKKFEILHDGHPALYFLRNHRENWSGELSEIYLHSIRKTFSVKTGRDKNQRTWSVLDFLPQTAMRMPIRSGEKDSFETDENYQPEAIKKLREFEEILKLRFQINRTFEREE